MEKKWTALERANSTRQSENRAGLSGNSIELARLKSTDIMVAMETKLNWAAAGIRLTSCQE